MRSLRFGVAIALFWVGCSGGSEGTPFEPEHVDPARVVGSWVFRGYECGSRQVYVDPPYAWSFVFDGTMATFTWDYAEGCRHVIAEVPFSDNDTGQGFHYGSSDAITCTPAACDATYGIREQGQTASIPTHSACEKGTHGGATFYSLTLNDTVLAFRQWTDGTLFGECRAVFDRVP